MPAGDTGLERQTVDVHDLWPEAEANVGLAAATREIARLREQVAEWESAHSVTLKLRSLIESHMDVARGQLRCVAEIDYLRAQLAAQQAVVEAAREVLNTISVGRSEGWFHWTGGSCLDELDKALAALDKAQAAQPEGEHAG